MLAHVELEQVAEQHRGAEQEGEPTEPRGRPDGPSVAGSTHASRDPAWLDFPAPLLVLASDGTIEGVSREGVALLGARVRDYIGQHWQAGLSPRPCPQGTVRGPSVGREATVNGLSPRPCPQGTVRGPSVGREATHFEATFGSGTDHPLPLRITAGPRPAGEPPGWYLVLTDLRETKHLELELARAQKLGSIGWLAAGIAHEINTPIQFVSDSVHFVGEAMTDLTRLIASYRELGRTELAEPARSELAARITEEEEEAELPYLLDQIPKALERSIEGLERVASIVHSMKDFAHPDSKEMAPVDLNRAIRSTATISRNEYKYVADLELDFEELPQIPCHVGDLNQAVLNIIVNAAHAIGEHAKSSTEKGKIVVRTRRDGEWVVISIADTGGGIPVEIQPRIFEPFFTTKGIGKGTGQGLAIARSIVREKHGGDLSFETEPGRGTTFYIRLPIAGKPPALPEAA